MRYVTEATPFASTLPSPLHASLESLSQEMKAKISEQMSSLLHKQLETSSMPRLTATVEAWCICLAVFNWLGLDGEQTAGISLTLPY